MGEKPFRNPIYTPGILHPNRAALVAEAREIVIQVWLNHVVDVGDLPFQSPPFLNVALQGQEVHLRETRARRTWGGNE